MGFFLSKMVLQGSRVKISDLDFKYISSYFEATETCNTATELSRDTFESSEKLLYEAKFAFFWQAAELTNKEITRY